MHARKVRPNKTKPAMARATHRARAAAINLLNHDHFVDLAGRPPEGWMQEDQAHPPPKLQPGSWAKAIAGLHCKADQAANHLAAVFGEPVDQPVATGKAKDIVHARCL